MIERLDDMIKFWVRVPDSTNPPWDALRRGLDEMTGDPEAPPEIGLILDYLAKARNKRWGAVYMIMMDMIHEEKKG